GRTRATPPGDHRIGTDGESDSVFQHANTKIRLQIATLAQYGGWDLIQLLVFQQRIEPSLAASQRQLALEHDAQLSPEHSPAPHHQAVLVSRRHSDPRRTRRPRLQLCATVDIGRRYGGAQLHGNAGAASPLVAGSGSG